MSFDDRNHESNEKFFGGNSAALGAISNILRDATVVRIASAYFEPTGWDLLSEILIGKDVRLLIGRPEKAEGTISDIVEEFISSINIGNSVNRIDIMTKIRDAIKTGKFLICVDDFRTALLQPRYIYHHAKLYIADHHSAVVTSANMTKTGLTISREAGYTVTNQDDVLFFADTFDEYFQKAEPLADLLLERIDEWLSLYRPFDVYMLSLIMLYGIFDNEKPGLLPELSGYQKPIVSRVIRNLEEFGGSIVVASTGLGKTIMAAHTVAHLASQKVINAAIVLCPSGLKNMWRRTMRAARISSIEFSYYILSMDDWRKVRDVALLERELNFADESTIIILDESHHMRNISNLNNPGIRHNRIMRTVDKNVKILLMTATPYSRTVEDINSQLLLLPHNFESNGLFKGTFSFPWRIDTPAEISDLKCGVVLTTPSVVKYFSYKESDSRRYVLFAGDKKRYFPHKIHIKNIKYINPIDDKLSELLGSPLLRVKSNSDQQLSGLFGDEKNDERRPLFEAHLVHRFCSSLKESDIVLEKLSITNGFEKIRFARQDKLRELTESIRKSIYPFLNDRNTTDDKIDHLVNILNMHKNEKAIIFCVYIETAEYIVNSLKLCLPQKKISSTVRKKNDELEDIITNFAPVANSIDFDDDQSMDEKKPKDEIDILVATTAMAEGFNFQDASILINFDLPWTVLILAQRMGRILRPWHTSRDIYIYTLIPSTMSHPGINHAMNWHNRLRKRNEDFSSFAEIPVIVEKSEEYEMFDLAKSLEHFEEVDMDFDEAYRFIENSDSLKTSSYIDDLASLPEHERKRLMRLPHGMRSIKYKSGSNASLYLLIRYKNHYYPALFNKDGEMITDNDRIDDIMRLVRSKPEEQCAPVTLSVEQSDTLIQKSVQNWVLKKQVESVDVSIRCLLFFS
jgi:superfamily II DNA or RNA helicase